MQRASKLVYVDYKYEIIFCIKLLHLLYFSVLVFLKNYFIPYTCKGRNLFTFILPVIITKLYV